MDVRTPLPRRLFFKVSGIGAIAASSFTGPLAAAELTPTEKANVKLVADFLAAWGEQSPDPVKIVGFLDEDCTVRLLNQTGPATAGRAAVLERFTALLAGNRRYELKILETFAKGPIVVNSRMDRSFSPGREGTPGPAVGVFFIKDGKIKDWNEYNVPKS